MDLHTSSWICILEHSGTFCNIQEHSGTFCYILELYTITLNAVGRQNFNLSTHGHTLGLVELRLCS